MVYVHSKLMVCDDAVAIIGSANINMRSLAGTRDTEIGTLLCQPSYSVVGSGSQAQLPRGHIHGFRMSLFTEHLKTVYPNEEDMLRDPSTLACSRFIQQRAKVAPDRVLPCQMPLPCGRAYGLQQAALEAVGEYMPIFAGKLGRVHQSKCQQ